MSHDVGGYRTLAQLGALHSPAPMFPAPPTPPPFVAPAPWPPVERHERPSTEVRHAPVGVDLLDHIRYPVLRPSLGDGDGSFTVPLTPIRLPTPIRAVREGTDMLREWHPRDPENRVRGSRSTREEDAAAQADGSERSTAARVAMLVGIGGGMTQNALDVVRTVKKYPEAVRAAAFDPSLGRLGRLPTAVGLTALTRPDNRLIDPRVKGLAASAETLGKSFDRFDDVTMKASVFLGASLSAIQIGAAIPNLADALGKDGEWYENLSTSTSGRAGVLQLVGGSIGAAVFGTALAQTKAQAGAGVVSRVLAAGSAPIMARPVWTKVFIGQAALVMANELGYFDSLNAGEERSTGATLTDAAHRTPVVNDPTWRTAALLGAGSITAFKAHRAIAVAGGMSGLGKGHWIGGAAVAGLLGAQLLGGLGPLDKPAED